MTDFGTFVNNVLRAESRTTSSMASLREAMAGREYHQMPEAA